MTGCCLTACTSAQAMKWVKDAFSERPAALSPALNRARAASSA